MPNSVEKCVAKNEDKSEDKRFYLRYLKETLGVNLKFLNFSKIEIPSTVSQFSWELGFYQTENTRLLFLLHGSNWESLSSIHKELFLKIRAAMKLNSNIQTPAVVAEWDPNNLSQFISSFKNTVDFIIFEEEKNKLEPGYRIFGDHTLVVVPSLTLMIKKQEYKKMAWERIKGLSSKLNVKIKS